jgi:hypothetical protein
VIEIKQPCALRHDLDARLARSRIPRPGRRSARRTRHRRRGLLVGASNVRWGTDTTSAVQPRAVSIDTGERRACVSAAERSERD